MHWPAAFKLNFKLENWQTVIHLMGIIRELLQMATRDLEDHLIFYLLIPIFEEHRNFLRFQWRETIYGFTALLFGFSLVSYIFTKILQLVVIYLHKDY